MNIVNPLVSCLIHSDPKKDEKLKYSPLKSYLDAKIKEKLKFWYLYKEF